MKPDEEGKQESENSCPEVAGVEQSEDEEWVNPPPECPYNCPYDPMNPQRPEYADETVESDIVAPRPDVVSLDENDTESIPEKSMTSLLRQTGAQADVHFQNVWQTKWETKVGVSSKKEYADVFSEELDWDISHHKWNSDRVQDTDMWEIDAEALFYVVTVFSMKGIDVTISDEVRDAYLEAVTE